MQIEISKQDFETLELAMNKYINITHHKACDARLLREDETIIRQRDRDYERALAAYLSLTGKSALASL